MNAVDGERLAAKRFDVCRYGNGFDAVWVVRVFDAESPNFGAFAQHGIATHHHMLLNDGFFTPFLDTGVHLQGFAIRGGANEFGIDFQQGGADDACGFDQLAPGRNTAFHKEVQRRCIHPLGKIGKEDDACGIAVTEHHLNFIDDCFAHVLISINGLTGRHAKRTVQANDLTVQVTIAHNVCGQLGKLLGFSKSGREGDAGSQRGLHRFRQCF